MNTHFHTPQRARNTDPVSSHLAAARSENFSANQSDLIVYALRKGGTCKTAKEIGCICDLTVVQVDRRLCEIRRAGLADVVQQDGKDMMRDGMRVWTAA